MFYKKIEKIIVNMQKKISWAVSPTYRLLVKNLPLLRDSERPNSRLIRSMQWHIAAILHHQRIFPPYRNIYNDREVVLVGAGPTLSRYVPIPGAVHIGVNRTFQAKNLKLDYLFIADYGAFRQYKDDVPRYCGPETKLFYGLFQEDEVGADMIIPEYLLRKHGAERFFCQSAQFHPPFHISHSLEAHPLMDKGSVIFFAMQFALYTNPRKIYLVGCDCSMNGYFDGKPQVGAWVARCLNTVKTQGWPAMKNFAGKHYPDTEIISVNPVGLKGLFTDMYIDNTD